MGKKQLPKFGGLDLAKRIDSSCLEVVTLKDRVLYHTGEKMWYKTDYKVVADDTVEILEKEKLTRIGADATGVGDAVIELFPKWMQKVIIPIKFTMPRKLEMIDTVQALFNNDFLKLHPKYSQILSDEILEQERTKTDAGNIIYKHPSGTHDDRFWALACACYVAAPYVYGRPRPTMATAESSREPEFDMSAPF